MTQQELGKYPVVYPRRAGKQEGALLFPRCARFQLWPQNLNLSLTVGRGMAAPLVVFGRNTSLTHKNHLFFPWSVLGALTSAITPGGLSPPPLVPMTTPPEGEPPSPPPGPGLAGSTCLAGDNSICPGLSPSPSPRGARAHSLVRPSSVRDVGRGGRTPSRGGAAPTPASERRGAWGAAAPRPPVWATSRETPRGGLRGRPGSRPFS